MSNSNHSVSKQASIGKQMKKYAICTLIAAFISLIASGVVQYIWFKYDAIISNEWLYISSDGYKDEQLSLIRLCQNTLFQKSIMICSLVSLAILVIYMIYDVIRTVREDEEHIACFVAKTVAVSVMGAIATAIHCVANFLGMGGFTYDDGLYVLEERSFLPIGGYEYHEVWSIFPKANIGFFVFLFLMVLIFLFSLYLGTTAATMLSRHTTKAASITTGVAIAVLCTGVTILARPSNIIVVVIAVVLGAVAFGAQILASRMAEKAAERAREESLASNHY